MRPWFGPLPVLGPRPPGTTYAYSFLVVAAFIPFGLAVWASRDGVPLRTAVGGALLLAALLLPAAATQSQDVFAYLSYGRLWAVHGANPYVVPPEAYSGDLWLPWMLWRDQVSVYGPLWTLVSGAVAGISGESIAVGFALVKTVSALALLVAVRGLVQAARDRGVDPGRAVVLFAWNPLVLVALPLGGHIEGAVAAALVWAMVADRRRRFVLAAALLAAASLIKAYAGLALVLYLVALWRRRVPIVGPLVIGVVLAVAAYAPFWAGPETFEGMLGIAGQSSSSFAGWVQQLLDAVTPADAALWIVRVLGVAALLAVGIVVARRRSFADDPWPGVAAAFATYVVVTPWFLYWHSVALVALAAVAASAPLRAGVLTFSGSSLLTISGGATPWGVALQTIARYGAPFTAWLLARRRTANSEPEMGGSSSGLVHG